MLLIFIVLLLFSSSLFSWPPSLENCGNTCFLNASLQSFYAIDPLTDMLHKSRNPYNASEAPVAYYYMNLVKFIKENESPEQALPITCENENLAFLDQSAYNLMRAHECSQQDATEFIEKFIDTLIQYGGLLKIPIEQLFTFDLVSTIKCPALLDFNLRKLEKYVEDQDHTSIFVEAQNQQQKKFLSLVQCLNEYFKVEHFERYRDEEGNERPDCTKQFSIKTGPEILLIALKRYALDPTTKERKKLDHRIYIPFELNMADFVFEKRRDPLADHYELISVIVHSGGISGGHYWAYVKEYDTGKWFKCNDATITQVDIKSEEVLSEIEGGSGGTGYGFIYQKKSIIQSYYNTWKKEENARMQKYNMQDLKNDFKFLSTSLKNLNKELAKFAH